MKELKWLTPKCCKEKRNYRIEQAIKFEKGKNVYCQKLTIVYKDDNLEIGFGNPGKDDGKYIKNSSKMKRDLTPYVKATDYPIKSGEFNGIWGIILKLQQYLSGRTMLDIYRLIYRLAFMIDFEKI